MASVASERKCLHRDLFERGDASNTFDDDDAFYRRTDLTTVKASNVWLDTVRSVRRIRFLVFRSPKAEETTDLFPRIWSHSLFHLLGGKLAHPFVTFSLSLSLFLSAITHHGP
jgi:hypothetical protein